jgi:hypothetical protein
VLLCETRWIGGPSLELRPNGFMFPCDHSFAFYRAPESSGNGSLPVTSWQALHGTSDRHLILARKIYARGWGTSRLTFLEPRDNPQELIGVGKELLSSVLFSSSSLENLNIL